MSGYVKAGATFLKNLLKGGKQKTTGTEVIDKFKPGTEFKGTPKYTKEMIKDFLKFETQMIFEISRIGLSKNL